MMSSFDETLFPFSTFHPNARAHLKNEISLLHPTLHTSQDGVCVAEPTVTNDTNLDHEVFVNLTYFLVSNGDHQPVVPLDAEDPGMILCQEKQHQIGSVSRSTQISYSSNRSQPRVLWILHHVLHHLVPKDLLWIGVATRVQCLSMRVKHQKMIHLQHQNHKFICGLACRTTSKN
jgi:hypothetical protein